MAHIGDMSEITCPKCHGSMRQYERSGVTVDQCSDCRGIFLDRGELERLIDGEQRWATAPGVQAAPQPTPAGYPPVHHRRRKSFLEELFD